MKYFDQHVHSYYSPDSKETVQAYINRAISLGFDTIEFTNHVDMDIEHYDEWVCDLNKEEIELNKYRKLYPNINIYQGVEIGYVPSKMDEIKALIKSHPNLNVINYSMHWFDGVDFYFIDRFSTLGIKGTLEMYFNATIEMISAFNDYDVLSHIDYAFKTIKANDRNASIKDYEKYIVEIFKIIIKNNKALEINSKCQTVIDDKEHMKYLLTLYKSMGGKYVTLSSDAHRSERLANNFINYISIIKECGFKELTVFVKRKPILVPIDSIIINNN